MSSKKVTTYDEFMKALKSYMKSKNDLKEIEKAYLYAKEKHEGQFRRTGEAYINHPLCVALILTSIHADKETIIAALLHDILEDTDTTKEELTSLFGKTVTHLVDGVTKINGINVSTENEYLTSYYKKIIVGMSEDVRVIIIKLADRLHNIRTLYVLPVEKQKRKAKETLEILAPIAHRLGMHKIKSELEDLSLKYLKKEAYYDIVEKLNNTKLERERYVSQMMEEVSTLLKQNNIRCEMKGRAKSIYSIYKKLDKGKPFQTIYDLLAIRILVSKKEECYQVLGLIHSKYKPMPRRFKDYIAMPKTNLYQSLHTTVFGLEGNIFEIQIRTYEMDEIAENGIACHWAYKEKKNATLEMQNATEQKLQFYKSIIELNEEKLSTEEFVTSVKEEVLNNNIYVYTPKGDVIELPKGATPIDFAYKVHTEVGDHLTGAIVNETMVPIHKPLENGDIIRVITNPNSKGPSREWLNVAKTTQAKHKIRNFFNRISKEDYTQEGKNLLEKELRKTKQSITEFLLPDHVKMICDYFKAKDINDLYFQIGTNKISCKSVVNVDKKEPTKIPTIKNSKNEKSISDIKIGEVSNVKTRMASCCMPVFGDPIIGYITKSSGISIHRKSCQNLDHEDERMIDVSWCEKPNNRYESKLYIYSDESKNLIVDIIQAATSCNAQVKSINFMGKQEESIYEFYIYVSDLAHLEAVIKSIYKIDHVTLVERVTR